MPLFHFHVEDGGRHGDPEQVDLPNVDAARQCAAARLDAMLSSTQAVPGDGDSWQMRVTDDAGRQCFSLQFLAVGATDKAGFDYRLPVTGTRRRR